VQASFTAGWQQRAEQTTVGTEYETRMSNEHPETCVCTNRLKKFQSFCSQQLSCWRTMSYRSLEHRGRCSGLYATFHRLDYIAEATSHFQAFYSSSLNCLDHLYFHRFHKSLMKKLSSKLYLLPLRHWPKYFVHTWHICQKSESSTWCNIRKCIHIHFRS